jgi:magnesium-transporting ATPase (P-type)
MESQSYAAKGNCTEQGLIRFIMDKTRNNDLILTRQNQRTSDQFLRASIPFDSKYKMSFAAIHIHSQGFVRIFGKGAPDFLIGHCTTVLNEKGELD